MRTCSTLPWTHAYFLICCVFTPHVSVRLNKSSEICTLETTIRLPVSTIKIESWHDSCADAYRKCVFPICKNLDLILEALVLQKKRPAVVKKKRSSLRAHYFSNTLLSQFAATFVTTVFIAFTQCYILKNIFFYSILVTYIILLIYSNPDFSMREISCLYITACELKTIYTDAIALPIEWFVVFAYFALHPEK